MKYKEFKEVVKKYFNTYVLKHPKIKFDRMLKECGIYRANFKINDVQYELEYHSNSDKWHLINFDLMYGNIKVKKTLEALHLEQL